MKKAMFLFAILVSNGVYAQTSFGNFKLSDQEIIYQKVFTADSVTVTKLEEYYKVLPYVSNIVRKTDGLDFDVTDMTVDYKKFQFSQVSTPSIIQTGKYSGKVSVGIKDGRYRITVNAIQLTGDHTYKKITAKENLTIYSSKNNGTVLAQDWCRPNMLGLLDKAFTDRLEYKKKDDGDW